MGDHNAPNTTPQPFAWLTPARRKAVYAILVALAPILAYRGLVSSDELTLWLNLAAAALTGGGGALAISHTPPTQAGP